MSKSSNQPPRSDDQLDAATPAAASSDDKATVDRLSRRKMFSGGILGLATVLGTACSSSDVFTSVGGKLALGKPTQRGGGGGDGVNGVTTSTSPVLDAKADPNAGPAISIDPTQSATSTGTGTNTGLGDGTTPGCYANDDSPINLAPTTEAPSTLITGVKFYGTMTSAMVAIQIGAKQDVQQIVIVTPGGNLLALHSISAADQHADGTFRPVVIDNIALTDGGSVINTLKILVQQSTGQVVHTEPVAFFNQFNGKPVIDLSAHTVPANFVGHQSVTQFDAVVGAFNEDDSVVYPNAYNTGTVRSLLTLNHATTWTQGAGVMGTVTDVMGNIITIGGGAIIEYQTFVTYVDNGSGSYVRTMLQIA